MVSGREELRHQAYVLRNQGLSSFLVWKKLKDTKFGVNLPLSTVEHWCTAMRKDPMKFMRGPATSRKGNPKANRHGKRPLTRADVFRIVNFVKKSPKISYRRVPAAMKPLGIDVSKSTVQRVAAAANVHSFKPTPKIILKRYHKHKRLAFAQAHEDFPWILVSFSDDKTFTLDGSHNSQNERYHAVSKSDVPCAPKAKSLTGVKFHGCTTSAGALPLIRLHKALKGVDFRRLLETTLPQIRARVGSGFIYQHDLSGEFRDGETQLFLQDHADDFISAEEWPSRSPDFNPMEDQWGEMARMVHEWQPKTKGQLMACVEKAWKRVNTPARLKALYDSMPNRMKEAIGRKGDMTGHQFRKIAI